MIRTINPIAAFFDILPGWVWAAIVAVVLAVGGTAVGVQTVRLAGAQVRLAGAQVQIAKLERDAEKLRADREQVARVYSEKARLDERAHAIQQQEIVNGYTQKLAAAEVQRTRDVARAQRVSGNAAAAAASDRDAAKGDPAACQRVADRNAVLYGLASEGFRLVGEGRDLLAKRDAAVDTLKGLVANDRARVCGGP